jgi:SAM-dependent methyltransferase
MPFRPTFDCLWCGVPHETSAPDDLEGWAQLCPACLGRAGDNGFLRMRLRAALEARAAAASGSDAPGGRRRVVRDAPGEVEAPREVEAPGKNQAAGEIQAGGEVDGEAHGRGSADAAGSGDTLVAYYAARAPEYDDWYLRRGRYDRGPLNTLAWQADLDAATLWLDGLPIGGEIVELAAGTGWWSPLLAGKGELSIYDAAAPPLELARARLVAHGLRAHIHLRDAWAEPDRRVDALFAGFWLSHVPRGRLGEFLSLARRWLRPGGTFAFIDSRPDPGSGAVDHVRPDADVSVRRLSDGREFVIPKVFYEPAGLESALRTAGFADAVVTTTARFFLLGRATA